MDASYCWCLITIALHSKYYTDLSGDIQFHLLLCSCPRKYIFFLLKWHLHISLLFFCKLGYREFSNLLQHLQTYERTDCDSFILIFIFSSSCTCLSTSLAPPRQRAQQQFSMTTNRDPPWSVHKHNMNLILSLSVKMICGLVKKTFYVFLEFMPRYLEENFREDGGIYRYLTTSAV